MPRFLTTRAKLGCNLQPPGGNRHPGPKSPSDPCLPPSLLPPQEFCPARPRYKPILTVSGPYAQKFLPGYSLHLTSKSLAAQGP